MTPSIRALSSTSSFSADVGKEERDVGGISRIYLVRHGDRFDYADPSWSDRAKRHGTLVTDPPLSSLGHRQAMETAEYLREGITKKRRRRGCHPVIATAYPTSVAFGNIGEEGTSLMPLFIEDGLSECTPPEWNRCHRHMSDMRTSHPWIRNTNRYCEYVRRPRRGKPMSGGGGGGGGGGVVVCRRTGIPCESFPGDYIRRMERFAAVLEGTYVGKTIILFSHAASVALVAALTRCSLRGMKFAPCGIYELARRVDDDGPWTLISGGGCNSTHVTVNSHTTRPWGFAEGDFDNDEDEEDDGMDMDYFRRT
ncbi:hypothetical protein ACHAXA_002122 [Cyclostephanos tholiformis]|uniref:Phosphoglycerate mutase family protein n=1 Tax=Cyclostephanos tholiformis TaxID=382380 RepID=A0ABD3RR31_9STRA